MSWIYQYLGKIQSHSLLKSQKNISKTRLSRTQMTSLYLTEFFDHLPLRHAKSDKFEICEDRHVSLNTPFPLEGWRYSCTVLCTQIFKNYFCLQKGFVPITGAQLIKVFEGYVRTVDWGAISNCTVNQTTFGITPSVGYFLADVIRNFNLNPRKIELIGRSVGGQIIGYTGAALNGTIARITGRKNLMKWRIWRRTTRLMECTPIQLWIPPFDFLTS